MEMGYIVAIILGVIVLLVALFLIAKNTNIMSGLMDGLRSLFGL